MVYKIRILIPIIMLLSSPATVFADEPDLRVNLAKRVADYNLGPISLVNALIRVSTDFKIPMGIALVDSPEARAVTSLAWKDVTVRQIIQQICTTPRERCTADAVHGVLHVFSTTSIPHQQNFLKKRIEMFTVNNAEVELASAKLHMLIAPIKGNHQFSVAGPGDSKVSFELKNSTVADTLDTIVRASNRKIWIVEFSDQATTTAAGFRRTESLFTASVIRDDQQPVWYLHRWGDPLPEPMAADLHTSPK